MSLRAQVDHLHELHKQSSSAEKTLSRQRDEKRALAEVCLMLKRI